MISPRTSLAILVWSLALASCSWGQAPERDVITVFCGSASKPAMSEIAVAYEEQTGITAELIFGGSGNLLSQMELSGKGDIYAPGSPDYIIIGERRGQLIEGSDRIVAYLVPAIITPAGNPAGIRTLEDLAEPGVRVGLGNPETVCLGLYSVELLEQAGLFDAVLPNVVTFGASCSKTANLTAMEQVDAVLGWRVFESWNPRRMEQVPIEPARIPRISTVPIAIPIHTRDRERSQGFIDFVLSPDGLAAFERHGYLVDRTAALELAPGADIGGEYQLPDDYTQRLGALGKAR